VIAGLGRRKKQREENPRKNPFRKGISGVLGKGTRKGHKKIKVRK